MEMYFVVWHGVFDASGPNSIPADIVFIVKDKDHAQFKRVGTDLHYVATIPLSKALIGCITEVNMGICILYLLLTLKVLML